VAYLNGVYLHITDESIKDTLEVSEHPVEKGADVTSHIQYKGFTMSLSGKIVCTDVMEGHEILSQIKQWEQSKTLLRYEGRNVVDSVVITSFSSSHPNTIMGGCEFDMELKQLRIAQNAYVADEKKEPETVVQQPTAATIKVGEIVVFKGGAVYVSSDAKQKAATRGRSTCKITKISRANWSVHQIHLISTDGGKVYGWVDESNIEGVKAESTVTKTETKAGTQQIQTG
jgi:hypothetical protein